MLKLKKYELHFIIDCINEPELLKLDPSNVIETSNKSLKCIKTKKKLHFLVQLMYYIKIQRDSLIRFQNIHFLVKFLLKDSIHNKLILY